MPLLQQTTSSLEKLLLQCFDSFLFKCIIAGRTMFSQCSVGRFSRRICCSFFKTSVCTWFTTKASTNYIFLHVGTLWPINIMEHLCSHIFPSGVRVDEDELLDYISQEAINMTSGEWCCYNDANGADWFHGLFEPHNKREGPVMLSVFLILKSFHLNCLFHSGSCGCK